MNRYVVLFAVIALSVVSSITSAQDSPEPIKDNSFLIEEAYNQPAGVVQWITTAQHTRSPNHFWGLAMTNEFPLRGMRHQLSWTLPFLSYGGPEGLGIGDISVHYRYQAIDGSRGLAFSPRATVFLPTGDDPDNGFGKVYWQTNLPISIELTSRVVFHANAGATLVPKFRSNDIHPEALDIERNLLWYNAGASLVWLMHPNLNVLCEFLYNSDSAVDEDGAEVRTETLVVNPGIRLALNASFGQFVPGFAIPFQFENGNSISGIFAYLSFEHSL